ncbi:MAG: hypothetical protein K0S23_3167 [Fluviicola sp.]|jgi:hypothetical protein|uniref:hypothetical protein n=1 Tax=Fluviicola sp. TaxID=1917219 RepID=UPI00261D9819|nr:hypothetical protein [Fluviicola sp.]MDF3028860.1 hypothetical protein [Fluviicola sp.]
MKKTITLFTLIFFHTLVFGQIVSPKGKSKPVRTKPVKVSTSDSNRIYVIRHAPQNMRFIQFGVELGTVFIADSAQRYYLPKKQVIHYGINMRIGDIYKNRVYGILGFELYAQKAYKNTPVTSLYESAAAKSNKYNYKNVFNFMGYLGCQVPFHLSELTSVNLSSALMCGISTTPNPKDEINYFGIRLAANVERRLGTLPVIGIFGIAYDNNFLFRDDRSSATRNPNLLKIYFGIRI